ncbi:MAG: T9SS type A sorting domain-containing protein [Melioribacteraceae bacterium]|jgi:hypothetical protein|nr:T9SS type A sorting domain-containing protein [Melioribacteraceae bacterium]
MKKVLTFLALATLFLSTNNGQWTNEGIWPDSTNYATHGIAVDPDGKVWFANHYLHDSWTTPDNDIISTAAIYVWNSDGTPADFSPIHTVNTGNGFVQDTLNSYCRGLGIDELGNILYVNSASKMFKIDYKTGEGIARTEMPEIGSSPTAPSVSNDGTIFVGPVVGGGTTQIATYNSDLEYLGAAVVGPPETSRTLEVSPDGLTIYWIPFTASKVYIYTRENTLSNFTLADSTLEGIVCESSAWNKKTGDLWVSNLGDNGEFTNCTWYAYNTDSFTIVDSLKWNISDVADEKPRGIDFNYEGNIAYIGTFANSNERMQKVILGGVGVKEIGLEIPSKYELSQNYPNPFNPTTVINFSIPQSDFVTVKVYNTLGQEVAELVNSVKAAGSFEVSFDASDLTSGMYIYKIQAGKFSATKKMLLLK